jgi:tolkin protein
MRKQEKEKRKKARELRKLQRDEERRRRKEKRQDMKEKSRAMRRKKRKENSKQKPGRKHKNNGHNNGHKKDGTEKEFYKAMTADKKMVRTKRAATARPERIWDYGVIPYEIEANFSGKEPFL